MTSQNSHRDLQQKIQDLEQRLLEKDNTIRKLRGHLDFQDVVLDNLPVGILVAAFETGIIEYINPTASLFLALAQEDILGKTCREINYPITQHDDTACDPAEKNSRTDCEILCGDGVRRHIQKSVVRVNTSAGGKILVFFHDITAGKQTEHRLRESEERTRATFNAITDSVFLHPLLEEGFAPFEDVNDTAISRYGYTREEFLRLKASEITSLTDAEQHAGRNHRKKLFEKKRLVVESTHITKSGDTFPVEINSGIIELGGKPMILAVARDISERKQAAEALHASHKRLLTILNSIDASIYVADMDSNEILFMNRNMIEVFGGDYTGGYCWEVFSRRSGPCDDCPNRKLVDADKEPTGVYSWQGKSHMNGRWYLNNDRAIEWIDRRIVKIRIATDITQLKHIEKQLEQSQRFKAIGTLAGGCAHDFNNLLMGIQGRLSLMEMDLEAGHPFHEHIEAAEEHIVSASDLTKQLLGLARGGTYEIKPTDLNHLAKNSLKMFSRTHKEISIHTTLQQPPPIVDVDSRQIEQVLLNLYINSWQAMTSGGKLSLQTDHVVLGGIEAESHQIQAGVYATVSVTDNGIGMDEATRKRIFDPFFTTKAKQRGTGLGLASAYGIIRNHSGTITVSSAPGEGATFTIFLPLSAEKNANHNTPVNKSAPAGSETILIIDDEQMILGVGKSMLNRLGYRAIAGLGGQEGIRLFQEYSDAIDLVLLDLIMPGTDGSEVFDAIRAINQDMPVILSSGYSLNQQANRLMEMGCNGFLQKPFKMRELSQKIRDVLEK